VLFTGTDLLGVDELKHEVANTLLRLLDLDGINLFYHLLIAFSLLGIHVVFLLWLFQIFLLYGLNLTVVHAPANQPGGVKAVGNRPDL